MHLTKVTMTLCRTALARAGKTYRMGLLFAHNNNDFCNVAKLDSKTVFDYLTQGDILSRTTARYLPVFP